MTITIKTGHTKPKPKTGPETFEEYRLEGFRAARDGVYRPEAYAKGMARNAYRLGRDQWVDLMAQER